MRPSQRNATTSCREVPLTDADYIRDVQAFRGARDENLRSGESSTVAETTTTSGSTDSVGANRAWAKPKPVRRKAELKADTAPVKPSAIAVNGHLDVSIVRATLSRRDHDSTSGFVVRAPV